MHAAHETSPALHLHFLPHDPCYSFASAPSSLSSQCFFFSISRRRAAEETPKGKRRRRKSSKDGDEDETKAGEAADAEDYAEWEAEGWAWNEAKGEWENASQGACWHEMRCATACMPMCCLAHCLAHSNPQHPRHARPLPPRAYALLCSLFCRDPSGNLYYSHSVTGESQWEAPLWIDQIDSASGTTYYLNTLTNETSWEMPSAFIPIVRCT